MTADDARLARRRLGHLLWQVTRAEWRHHAMRQGVAVLAVLLGVALAFSVHLINESALGEFSSAVRSVQGQADATVKAARGGLPLHWLDTLADHPDVAVASPVVEVQAVITDARGAAVKLPVLGLDPLLAAAVNPDLLPRAESGQEGRRLFAPDAVSANARAAAALGWPATAASAPLPAVALIVQGQGVSLQPFGRVAHTGAPLLVMDIAGAQALTGRFDELTRIELRLRPGADLSGLRQALPAGVVLEGPDEGRSRLSNLSQAYRVNLTVLALVALFTGAFLVFSVQSLSVAQRQPSLALLGVLGLGPRERLTWVLAESALTGLIGAALGLVLGTVLAGSALHLLGGDLGGGYFTGVKPVLRWSWAAAGVYGGLGVVAAVLGGWWPARDAAALAPAQALKGLGGSGTRSGSGLARWSGPGLLVLGTGLSLLPPVAGLPLAAYVGVACLLVGGIVSVPAAVALVLGRWPEPDSPSALLALERARRMRHTVTVAVAGVVASLSLSVALTVMVGSFRGSVTQWLDVVLPADLYARVKPEAADGLPADALQTLSQTAGVRRVSGLRSSSLRLNPALPDVALVARELDDPPRNLPLVGDWQPVADGEVGVFVSEAMVDLYGAAPGRTLALPLKPGAPPVPVKVQGVWRDYARQHGTVVMAQADWQRLTGDRRINDVALWLDDPQDTQAARLALQAMLAAQGLPADAVELAEPGEIRALTLQIFDRSFAVTYWLQAVAIGIGLFGTAASFSAQVLARRKEFGLLAHLGFTRRQVLAIVGGEGLALTGLGAVVGLLLGLAVSLVLVKVVNPQSFHWTMDLLLPWGRLLALCAAVVLAGTVTAVVAGRRAASEEAVLAVKEDW